MVRRRTVGLLAFGGAAVAGAAVGWAAERRAVAPKRAASDPEWAELSRPVHGHPVPVTSRDGTRLHVEVLGPEQAPTLVVLHGYALSQHFWHYQRRDLPPDLRVVAYDMRGHASSAPAASGDYSLHALADDLAAVIEATTPAGRHVVVAGHSMGGMTVMALADRHPDIVAQRLAGAVLVSTGAANLVRTAAFAASANLLGLLEGPAALRAVTTSVRGYRLSDASFLGTREIALNRHASPAHVAFVEQLFVDVPNAVKASLAQTLSAIDVRSALETLECPVLVLVGTSDKLTPPRQARAIAEALPDARLVELPGVGHSLPLEAHEAVTAHLRAFTLRAAAGAA